MAVFKLTSLWVLVLLLVAAHGRHLPRQIPPVSSSAPPVPPPPPPPTSSSALPPTSTSILHSSTTSLVPSSSSVQTSTTTTSSSPSAAVTSQSSLTATSSSPSGSPTASGTASPSATPTTAPAPSSGGDATTIALAVGGSCVVVAALGIYIFRKWKLKPSDSFRDRINPNYAANQEQYRLEQLAAQGVSTKLPVAPSWETGSTYSHQRSGSNQGPLPVGGFVQSVPPASSFGGHTDPRLNPYSDPYGRPQQQQQQPYSSYGYDTNSNHGQSQNPYTRPY